MHPLSGRFPSRSAPVGSRTGFTITELLIAATISLILTYAVVQMFDYVASEARYGRASIELASQLRNASRRISTDLACATAPVRPFADRHGQGYFEYLEGPGTDSVAMVYDYTAGTYTPGIRTNAIDGLSTVAVETSLGGDIDDILMFTAYNPDEPFRGRYKRLVGTPPQETTEVIESKYAEIAIWTVRDPSNGRVRLYRRALLIRPDLVALQRYTAPAVNPSVVANVPGVKQQIQTFYQENDISVRLEYAAGPPAAARLVGNTLADLQRRENRFAHLRPNDPSLAGGPYLCPIDADALQVQNPASLPVAPGWLLTNDTTNNLYFEGNDVLLAEVLAFDVKAFDPLATVRLDPNSFALSPSDPGYLQTGSVAVPTPPTGAFVDLGYSFTNNTGAGSSWFSGNGNAKSRVFQPAYFASAPPQYAFRTYCTWSLTYEMNGIDENGDGIVDGGTNGIDDNNNGIVDELDEWDTSPPYPFPLRGVQVTLRVMEPNSRQVRQMSVVQNFTGE